MLPVWHMHLTISETGYNFCKPVNLRQAVYVRQVKIGML